MNFVSVSAKKAATHGQLSLFQPNQISGTASCYRHGWRYHLLRTARTCVSHYDFPTSNTFGYEPETMRQNRGRKRVPRQENRIIPRPYMALARDFVRVANFVGLCVFGKLCFLFHKFWSRKRYYVLRGGNGLHLAVFEQSNITVRYRVL